MKVTHIVFLVPLIILSCKKEVHLGNDFNRLIGHWENVGEMIESILKLKKMGK